MKTFYEFIENKKLSSLIERAANLMVELDVDPAQFILEYVSNEPKLESSLLEYIEMQEGIMDTLGRVKDAAVAFGKNVWDRGGIKGGWHQGKDVLMGPLAKFNTAIKVMNDLVASLNRNPQTKDMMTGDDPAHPWARGKKISEYIQDIINQLEKQRPFIPKMQDHPAHGGGQMVQPGP